MGKTIKMIAVVDGNEVSVGRCHPGQARLLRKYGMADWDKGRILLPQSLESLAPPKSSGVLMRDLGLQGFTTVGPARPPVQAPHIGWRPDGWQKKLRLGNPEVAKLLAELDLEGQVDLSRSNKGPEMQRCESMAAWLLEIPSRRGAGHTLFCCDDPRRMVMGFLDDTTDEYLGVGLRQFKEAGDSEFEAAGTTRKAFGTLEGRTQFIEGDADFHFGKTSEEDANASYKTPPDPELRDLWLADARAEIAQYEKHAHDDLADQLGLLSTHEIPRPVRGEE
jgi:hypothetical protein